MQKFKLVHLPTLKTFKYSDRGDILDYHEKRFLTDKYLDRQINLFLSTWIDDEAHFLLAITPICDNDIEISPKELAWIEDD